MDRVVFCGLLLWTFLSLCFPLADTDFWWHLKTGEWILQNGAIPQVDLYTFSSVGRPWIDLHWGFQLLITLLYRLGGIDLVILTKAAVITAAVAVAWSAGGGNLPVCKKAGLWILPIVCIVGRGFERPDMLSLLFLAGWLWMARHVEERPKLIWFLPLLQLVWVNCHALFVLGLVVGAGYVIDCLARDLARGKWGLAPSVPNPPAKSLIWAGLLIVAACFINPYFEEGAFFPLTLYRKFTVEQEFYSQFVLEFRQPVELLRMRGWRAVLNPFLMAELGVWCLTAASFAWLYWRQRRWSILRLMLFAAFSHLAWEATRNSNLFALVCAFVTSENLGDAFTKDEQPVHSRSIPCGTCGMLALTSALIVAVVTGWWNDIGHLNRPFRLGESTGFFVHGAARFAGGKGFPDRAFVAHNGQAGVYIYHNAPDRFVYIDGRLEVCTRETFQTYYDILTAMAMGNPAWQSIFQDSTREMPIVILDNRSSLYQIRGMLAMPGWRVVYADEVAAAFLTDGQADALSLPRAVLPPALDRNLIELEATLKWRHEESIRLKSQDDARPER